MKRLNRLTVIYFMKYSKEDVRNSKQLRTRNMDGLEYVIDNTSKLEDTTLMIINNKDYINC